MRSCKKPGIANRAVKATYGLCRRANIIGSELKAQQAIDARKVDIGGPIALNLSERSFKRAFEGMNLAAHLPGVDCAALTSRRAQRTGISS
jgi:hypothetical protein